MKQEKVWRAFDELWGISAKDPVFQEDDTTESS